MIATALALSLLLLAAGRVSGEVARDARPDEKTNGDVVVHPMKVRGWAVTPDGQALPGAAVRAVAPGYYLLGYALTRNNGSFALSLPSNLTTATFVVVAPRLPARIIDVSVSYSLYTPIRIVVGTAGGRLRILFPKSSPMPTIRKSGDAIPLSLLAEHPYELTKGAFAADIEPGDYTVCLESKCEPAAVTPRSNVLIDLGR